MFRMEVVSADGARCGVPIQVDSHPAQTRPYVLNAIADALLIRRDEIRRVLDEGTAGMLRRHLCRYTQAQLRPFQARTDHPERHSFFDVGPEDIPTPTTQRKD